MRILFVNHTSDYSGAEVVLLGLARALTGEHHVAVACPSPGHLADVVTDAGIPRTTIPATDLSLRPHPVHTPVGIGRIAAAGLALRAAARSERADVIHANSPRAGLVAAVAARLGCPPVVVQVHDHLPQSLPGRATRAAIGRTAQEIVAVTDYTARDFNTGLRVPRAQRVYVGVDLARFDPARVTPARVREELGLPPDAALIGQVSQITPWKGQDRAIRMLAALRAKRPDAHLLLVGAIAFRRPENERYLDRLHALVLELGLRDHVHFLGRREDVPAVVGACALTVLPSSNEPFGTAAVESMAMGVPPLVTAVGGPPEYVSDGENGRVLPPDSSAAWAGAADELLGDPERLARMGEAAKATAARFTTAAYAKGMVDVYHRAVAGAARRAAG